MLRRPRGKKSHPPAQDFKGRTCVQHKHIPPSDPPAAAVCCSVCGTDGPGKRLQSVCGIICLSAACAYLTQEALNLRLSAYHHMAGCVTIPRRFAVSLCRMTISTRISSDMPKPSHESAKVMWRRVCGGLLYVLFGNKRTFKRTAEWRGKLLRKPQPKITQVHEPTVQLRLEENITLQLCF